jgi:hypothetical protein
MLNFPSSPTLNEEYIYRNRTWVWNGVGWSLKPFVITGYQPTLISGTNIKTVNGQSVLGSGNIQIDGGVVSFNTRTGAVTLTSEDVTTVLGFTPYNATNPAGYLTSYTETDPVFVASPAYGVTFTNITNWDTAYGWGNHASAGYLTGITSGQVTTALGFTPYSATNPSGYITASALAPYLTSGNAASTYQPIGSYLTGITSGQVTTALGFTPYNASNPSGYITSAVTSVSGSGTVNGLTLTGTVTSSGDLTLGGTLDLSAPPAIGVTTPNTGVFTNLTVNDNTILGSSNTDTVGFNARVNSDIEPSTNNAYDLGRNAHAWRNLFLTGTANIAALTASGSVTLNGGTANGVAYLNGSKVLTTGSALTFDGANLGIGTASPVAKLDLAGDYKEGVVTANTGTTYTISTATGTVQILTLTGNCTFTFPTATAGQSFILLLKQDGTGGRTVTWPASVEWPGGTAPTITSTASKMDKFVFTAADSNWYGSVAGQSYTV